MRDEGRKLMHQPVPGSAVGSDGGPDAQQTDPRTSLHVFRGDPATRRRRIGVCQALRVSGQSGERHLARRSRESTSLISLILSVVLHIYPAPQDVVSTLVFGTGVVGGF